MASAHTALAAPAPAPPVVGPAWRQSPYCQLVEAPLLRPGPGSGGGRPGRRPPEFCCSGQWAGAGYPRPRERRRPRWWPPAEGAGRAAWARGWGRGPLLCRGRQAGWWGDPVVIVSAGGTGAISLRHVYPQTPGGVSYSSIRALKARAPSPRSDLPRPTIVFDPPAPAAGLRFPAPAPAAFAGDVFH